MWYIVFLNKGKLYMKHLLILLCVCTLTACGIKNKLLNSSSGSLGVSKQPTKLSSPTIVSTSQPVIQSATSPSQSTNTNEPTKQTESSVVKWYYTLPFVGLAIIALLVYRLKQQNMKSL